MNADPNDSDSMASINVCTHLPPSVNSRGLSIRMNPLKFSLPVLELQIIMICFVTQLLHFVLKPLGQPQVVAQMIAGLIIGPSLIYTPLIKAFPFDSHVTIGTLSLFGYSLFMFLVGVKMDVGMIRKTGNKALAAGILALLAPLIIGTLVSWILAPNMDDGKSIDYLPYLTATNSLTSFPVISCLLSELKLLNSELGRLALSSAIVCDLFSVFLVSAGTMAKTGKELSYVIAGLDMATTIFFIGGAVFIFRPAMFWVIKKTPEGRPVADGYILFIILAVLLSGLVSNQFRQFVIFGPYILGLVVPDGPPLGSTLVNKLDPLVSGLLMPLFVTTCTLRADMFVVDFKGTQVWINIILVIVTFSTKIIATMLPLLYCKVPFYDAVTTALIMSCKGTVELATYSLLRDSQYINEETFTVMAISTLLSASIVPALVQHLYDPSRKYAGYQKRTIMHWRPESELRILSCIHRSDSIAAMINLVDASCPTTENPIAIYVLHLIELVGRASPLFISHQLHRRVVSNRSLSENVLIAFSNYGKNNPGGVTVQAFTAISPPKLMHEDICTLALNKLTSLIIIPFHLKFAINGSLESEDHNMRNVINSVLDRAPCSVAVLVDRGHLGRANSLVSSQLAYCVAMLFIGGSDDREALAYAKFMARDPTIRLRVIRFTDVDEEEEDEASATWEKMLDAEMLKDIKFSYNDNNGYVTFMEEKVRDGPQTALIIRSMVDEYDLIIVGRRHNVESPQTSGLGEWCEYSELGIMGDLLSSADLDSRASVLVMQQQVQLK